MLVRILFFILRLVGYLPRFILKGLSAFFFFVIRLIGYRRAVINQNLEIAFPEKSKEEKRQIRIEFYKILADYLIEFFILLGADPKKMVGKTVSIENESLLNEIFENKRAVFLLTGHIFNWEWVGILGDFVPQKYVYGAFKPLKNKQVNKEIEKLRFRLKGVGIPSKELMHQVRNNSHLEDSLYYLIIDQSPKKSDMKNFVQFFGVPTPIFGGFEILVRSSKGVPVFIYPQKIGLGKYIYHLTEIKSEGTEFKAGELIDAFYQELERHIKQYPANWLWSHRRWKNLEN